MSAPSAAMVPVPELTARQAEVLRLVAQGLSNAEIARRLGLSLEGVKTHVSHLLLLTGCSRRVQLVVLVHRSAAVLA
jgi:DNA-binding CsgD family transcriptional regulator